VFTAAVIEADADADLPWVATAYIPAPSLSTLVRAAGPLPVPALRWLAAGCSEALASIHGAGLLHRDVKPSNVLVAPDGPRVIDFGLARAAERVQLTATRGASGTPAYMAPEQARDATLASPASDIFSLGATLVFAATGHSPYQGDTIMDILVRLATEPPDLSGVPAELTGMLSACLQRVPRERPTSAAILAGLGPLALPGGDGHGYLPDSAMAVIADYQRAPLPPGAPDGGQSPSGQSPGSQSPSGESAGLGTAGSGAGGAPGGDTTGSDTALPGYRSVDRVPGGSFSPGSLSEAGFSGTSFSAIPGPGSRRHRSRAQDGTRVRHAASRRGSSRRRPLPAWARAAAAVLLLAAGAGIGLLVSPPGAQAPSGGGIATTGTTAQGSTTALGPTPAPPASCPRLPPGDPELCVSQPWGDGRTVYVLIGIGFKPGQPVTISLAGVGVSAVRAVPDESGMFNYAVDQGHVFFPGAIPTGTYHVVAGAAGQQSVSASFRVYPDGQVPPQPRPSAPPGSPPPGQ
jgi:hypothetical protein